MAEPVTTLSQSSFAARLAGLRRLIEQYQPDKVILGVSSTKQQKLLDQQKQLIDALVNQLDVDVELWQEDYSTRRAFYLAQQAGRKPARLGNKIHSLSAAVILQDYLEQTQE